MRAPSIRQAYPELILQRLKTVDYRSWATKIVGERFWIYASKRSVVSRVSRGVADDPYRSLAWFVRKSGAFENSTRNFAEFKWANFFRDRRLLDRDGPAGMPRALLKAVALAQSPAAKSYPASESSISRSGQQQTPVRKRKATR